MMETTQGNRESCHIQGFIGSMCDGVDPECDVCKRESVLMLNKKTWNVFAKQKHKKRRNKVKEHYILNKLFFIKLIKHKKYKFIYP